MTRKLMGKKRGMIQVFDDKGNLVVGTVIEAEPNVVTHLKTVETDGYNAIQLGFEEVNAKDERTAERRVSKPLRGHFAKNNIKPRKHLAECRLDNVEEYQLGQEIGVDLFAESDFVDVTATSIGKGYQGVMKLHGFSGMNKTHGAGPVHRHAGATGMRSTPGRCFKGGKRASQMGNRKTTVQNLKVVMVKPEDNIIVLAGSIPGPKNSLVTLCEAVKKPAKKSEKSE